MLILTKTELAKVFGQLDVIKTLRGILVRDFQRVSFAGLT